MKSCKNCRFKEGNNIICNDCSVLLNTDVTSERFGMRTEPSNWQPMTEAQKLEQDMNRTRSGLSGNMHTGYTYEPTKKEIEYMKNDVKATTTAYNKMYKNKSPRQKALERIKKVIFNDPCTIVLWNDGTKTVVKCGEDDVFDPEKGLAMAISKYFFDNKGYFNDVFKKFVQEEKDEFDELPRSLKETIDKASHKIQNLENVPNTKTCLYSVKELAVQFECSESSILRDIKKGKFPGAKKEHGKWVIPCEF